MGVPAVQQLGQLHGVLHGIVDPAEHDVFIGDLPARALEETVTKYNAYVDAGKDPEFGKPAPKYKIQTPPFYAAWATPVVHDTRAGLRINARCQVVDMNGAVIPGLYCGGESAGGFSMHGLPRAVCQGFIAGREAVTENS